MQYANSQDPKIIRAHNFGELNGSAKEGLKYIDIKPIDIAISQVGSDFILVVLVFCLVIFSSISN